MKKITALAVIGTAFFVAWTRYRLQLWDRAIRKWQDELQGAAGTTRTPPQQQQQQQQQQSWDDLPAVVHRYFSEAIRLPVGTEVRSVRFSQIGKFRMNPPKPDSDDEDVGWTSFTAEQVVAANPPGFVWDASIAMFPSFERWPLVQVCDAWAQGNAALKVALMNVWELTPLAQLVDKDDPERQRRLEKELEVGEAMRWLAEAFLVPTSLFPSEGLVVWLPVILPDNTSSSNQAVLHFHESFQLPGARLVVTFDETTHMPLRIEGFRPKWIAASRNFDIGRWQGHFEEFQQIDVGGDDDAAAAILLVPAHMKVGWINPTTGHLELYFDGFNYDLHFSLGITNPPAAKTVIREEAFTTTIE